jgi:hypothetical protein
VLLAKCRNWIERAYQDLKGELGLDHFESRSYVGWHHHVSVCLAAYAFLLAEQSEAFSPGAPSVLQARSTRFRLDRSDPEGLPLRPERHTPSSLRTIRQLILCQTLAWLPRCPACRRAFPRRTTAVRRKPRAPRSQRRTRTALGDR